jgi:DNA-binding response OmpR family regulator
MRTVLIIDDDPLIRKMLQDSFQEAGFRVFLAEDGKQGLELLTKVIPDAVILDKLMPQASGSRFLLWTKEIKLPKKPVLVVYSSLVKESSEAPDPGIFACEFRLAKSAGPEELVKKVKQLMEQHHLK